MPAWKHTIPTEENTLNRRHIVLYIINRQLHAANLYKANHPQNKSIAAPCYTQHPHIECKFIQSHDDFTNSGFARASFFYESRLSDVLSTFPPLEILNKWINHTQLAVSINNVPPE